MKGFVPTPRETVDTMVDMLFRGRPPKPSDTLLDPGCGTGEFIDGVIRWCNHRRLPFPHITGIESDPQHLPILNSKYQREKSVLIKHADFLKNDIPKHDFVIGNPPYVAITSLSEEEKAQYRLRYVAARGRFDLYLLFFEQGLRNLAIGGRIVFITPEKYLYVETAGPLRDLLAKHHVEEIRLLGESTFPGRVAYPTITSLVNKPPEKTVIVRRDGKTVSANLPLGKGSWMPFVEGAPRRHDGLSLGDVCLRISCGVATGADSVFVHLWEELEPPLRSFARPTVAGRELTPAIAALPERFAMLIPYDAQGRLLPIESIGPLGRYLMRKDVRQRLLERTCVKHKPWYAFHETPNLPTILRPKILCKDICDRPRFWVDWLGEVVPRHSVYYIVPREPEAIEEILAFLRSLSAQKWLLCNCQRAAKGFLRLQSRILQSLPLPDDLTARLGGPSMMPSMVRPMQKELSYC